MGVVGETGSDVGVRNGRSKQVEGRGHVRGIFDSDDDDNADSADVDRMDTLSNHSGSSGYAVSGRGLQGVGPKFSEKLIEEYQKSWQPSATPTHLQHRFMVSGIRTCMYMYNHALFT